MLKFYSNSELENVIKDKELLEYAKELKKHLE